MKHTTYLKKSQKPRVVVYDDKDNPIEMNMGHTTRPSIDEINRICKQRQTGRICFTDVFDITITQDTTMSRSELYYGDECVGYRSFPDIHMRSGDSLQVSFSLVIDSIPGYTVVK